MRSTKITEGDINDKKVASLPTRPTAPAAFGGRGYTAKELKEAFDLLPLFLVERFNLLIEDINGDGGEGIADAIKTSITPTHTLRELFEDIKNGSFTAYLAGPEGSVAEYLLKLREDVDRLASILGTKL